MSNVNIHSQFTTFLQQQSEVISNREKCINEIKTMVEKILIDLPRQIQCLQDDLQMHKKELQKLKDLHEVWRTNDDKPSEDIDHEKEESETKWNAKTVKAFYLQHNPDMLNTRSVKEITDEWNNHSSNDVQKACMAQYGAKPEMN